MLQEHVLYIIIDSLAASQKKLSEKTFFIPFFFLKLDVPQKNIKLIKKKKKLNVLNRKKVQ